MNVFEDLIDELKDDNLLEATILEVPGRTENISSVAAATPVSACAAKSEFDLAASRAAGTVLAAEAVRLESSDEATAPPDPAEFYRKRAIDEVSSLQMVEHVISGIEREYLKALPSPYDDLRAKTALHKFLQVSSKLGSEDYAEAEFTLLQETEAWTSDLSRRDEKISAANLRRFCENSRPALSSQALISVARFYRNSPFSESGRAKFDFVMTRLFARDTEEQMRSLLFSRGEMIEHIQTFYAGWNSVSLFSADEHGDAVKKAIAKFDKKIAEAEAAASFDALVGVDFFRELHAYKDEIGELFFVPDVTAAAVECNVRVGNRFVELIYAERQRSALERIEEKYGYTYDQLISEAASKTLRLVELLKCAPSPAAVPGIGSATLSGLPGAADPNKAGQTPQTASGPIRINKWILIATFLVLAATGGLYLWSEMNAPTPEQVVSAKQIDLANTELGPYLRTGRASSTTFYAVTQPAWDDLTDDQKKDLLVKSLAFAAQMKLERVQFVNYKGRTVAFAVKDRVELMSQ